MSAFPGGLPAAGLFFIWPLRRGLISCSLSIDICVLSVFGKALINLQNRISYVFLSNAASSVSLNSSLFASTDSLH